MTTDTGEATAVRRTHRAVLLATGLGFAVIQLDVSVVNVAIKPIGAALGGGVAAQQWVVDAYTVALAALMLTAGALGDRIGARRIFLGGFALFTLASVACGLAPNLAALITSRAVQGGGAAALGACSLSLLNHTFTEPGARARAVGLWAAVGSTALAGGPFIGGLLIETLGWRAIFFINVPIGLVGGLLTYRFAAETTRTPGRGLDPWGQAGAIVALTALAGAAITAGSRGTTDPLVLAAFGLAVVAGAAFFVAERKGRSAMLPLRLFRSVPFSASVAVGLLVSVAFYGLIFVLSLFFQRAQGLSSLATGLAFVPMMAAVMVSNVTGGRLARRIGAPWVIVVGAALIAAGCLAALPIGATTAYPAMVVQFVALGGGLGLVVPAMTAALLGSVERTRSGVAAGTLNAMRQTGSVLGVALLGSLVGHSGPAAGLHSALIIGAVLAVPVAALGVLIARSDAAART